MHELIPLAWAMDPFAFVVGAIVLTEGQLPLALSNERSASTYYRGVWYNGNQDGEDEKGSEEVDDE